MKYSTDIVVLDLEATCPERDSNTIERSEIIDVGAVRLDRKTLRVSREFSELVRPTQFEVGAHITEFTGITQRMVSGCDPFAEVGRRFVEWCGPRNRFVLAVFGAYYDIPLLRKECEAAGIDYRSSFVGGALDIRGVAMAWLADHDETTTGVTVEKTVEKMGIDLDVSFHRALDDAQAEAAILQFSHLGTIVK